MVGNDARATGAADKIDALGTLLRTAGNLVRDLIADPEVARLLTIFARLPVHDRRDIVDILEREEAFRRLATSVGPATGMQLPRPNPNAQLYVRVVDGETNVPADNEQIILATQRFVRQLPLLFLPAVRDRWLAAAESVLPTITSEERDALARLAHECLELVGQPSSALPPVSAPPRAVQG